MNREMTPAIEVSDLRFRYPGSPVDSLRGVDLRIQRGDFVAVVGGNGSGKTTLCKSFNGLIPHFWNGDISGTVRCNGRSTAHRTVGEIAREVGYVFQDFGNQIVRPTPRDDISFGPLNFGCEDWWERTEAVLTDLGIAHIADAQTWQLSGGQQHLTALAGVLALAPDIIVVDEPAAEVDPLRASVVYDHLARLNERGITVIVIEHHAELVAKYAKTVVLMSEGQVSWCLPVAEALSRTADLEAADIPAPQVVAAARALVPDVARGIRAAPLTVEECAEAVREARGPDASGLDLPTVAAGAPDTVAAGPAQDPGRTVAEVRGITVGYQTISGNRSTVIDDLDLQLHAGERVALVGSNGAGKSTLLSTLSGMKLPRYGSVVIDGHDTSRLSPSELAGTVCYLVQRPDQMFLQDSISADIGMFPRSRGLPDAAEITAEVLDRVGLSQVGDRDGRLLSGGQQRRATLAIGLAMRPTLLLLDEPTSSLDLRSRDDVIDMLDALAEHILCSVVATHDMHLVAEWSDRVIVLDHGRIIADTDPTGLFADRELLDRARLVPPQVTQLGQQLGLDPIPLSLPDLIARTTHAEEVVR
ncbi:ABC transporter ATP-binding protein [Brevibacterium sp. CFH 10365]|uniref:ABC transporter ATP-binding protein n=1 Tax=Brevibacterium sp. CFH 10365 TaxID=2585207 RepID=UPI00126647F3|nr:ABC transporter ATP-binding protein [Brevibacterium sp. CFH 10365]